MAIADRKGYQHTRVREKSRKFLYKKKQNNQSANLIKVLNNESAACRLSSSCKTLLRVLSDAGSPSELLR